MDIQEISRRLVEQLGDDAVLAVVSDAGDPWIEVPGERVVDVGSVLRDDPALQFDHLCNLTAVDYFEPDPKQQKKFGHDPHLEVVYHLMSVSLKHQVVVKVKLPRWEGDQEGALPSVPSVSDVWAIADWHEREAYDMMGINFIGHPSLVRILCPDDWVGHPLRKDYEFPLEYHGVRGK